MQSNAMTPQDFISKWKNGGDERRDAQPFFEDLCRLVGHQTPREADPEHHWFTYEYGATKTSGGDGWADVWKRGFFGWEAKGTHKSLDRAYEQLKMYADALQNPPLLVVSDLQTIIVHTNFTNTVKREYKFTVADLDNFETRQILEAVFKNPDRLRPGTTRAAVTKEAADKFTALAQNLRGRGHEAHAVAHFLNRLLFCMFAEDIGLLSSHLFTKLVESSQDKPDLFEKRSRELFAAMHSGGDVAFENVEWFNGGLFEDDDTLRLEADDLKLLLTACRLDWSEIEPSVFGTLFERGLDPDKRSQLGAHYTDPETIMKIVRPVVIEPWLAEWEAEKAELAKLIEKAALHESTARDTAAQKAAKTKALNTAQTRFTAFLERLRAFTVLDPACGSGNFLYLALRSLKDTEKRILIEGEMLGLPRQFPDIGPKAVKGIELNGYAAELARVTIWIGEIQWMIANGYGAKKNPILQPLEQIEHRDALLNSDGTEAAWPMADVVVGNPPFLGSRKMKPELGDSYVKTLRKVFDGRVTNGADLVCFWFGKAWQLMSEGALRRAGLVATNSIAGGTNRKVLEPIAAAGKFSQVWPNEPWIVEGAAVRVAIIVFDENPADCKIGDERVSRISSDLKAASDSPDGFNPAATMKLRENAGISYQGITPRSNVKKAEATRLGLPDASFVLDGSKARLLLNAAGNPNGRPNADVIFPYLIGDDITSRPLDRFIVDFGTLPLEASAMYEEPFQHIETVKLHRAAMSQPEALETWWRHWRTRQDMRAALAGLPRFIVTPRVATHRLFAWCYPPTLVDNAAVAIARSDDTTFGLLHSTIHEVWALRRGTFLGVGDDPRYTPTTTFEEFAFPEGLTPDVPAANYAADPRAVRIADTARKLVEARDRWLNPPEWTERVPEVVAGYPDRIVAKAGHEADLKKRTLTNLYNERPTWLANLHRDLDEAVAAAYGWEWPLPDDEILKRLFDLNQERARQSS